MNVRGGVRKRTVLFASLIVVLALLVVAGAVWRYSYIRSPKYSLNQLAQKAAAKDWDGVQKYVDFDAVVSHEVDATTTALVGGSDTWYGAIAAGVAEWAKPTLTRGTKYVMRTGIEMGPDRPETAVELTGLYAAMSVKTVTYEGGQALVTVEAHYGDERTIDFTLRMKRVDDFWRVIAVEDFPELQSGDER